VNFLLTTVFVLLFFTIIYFHNLCEVVREANSTTAVLNTGISLYVIITSIRDSVDGVILVVDLTVFIILELANRFCSSGNFLLFAIKFKF